jgi:hypothetical protein
VTVGHISTPQLRDEIRRKWDRHPAYVYIHVGLWFVALGIMLTPLVPNASPVGLLSWQTQRLLAVCMFAGSTAALLGTAMGTRVFKHDTEENPLDLRYPFIVGAGALAAMSVSLFTYFLVILAYSDVVGTLGGGLSVCLGVFGVHMSVAYVRQVISLGHRRTAAKEVLEEIAEELAAEGDSEC